jgi:glycosyltransferase involved in cell wall biosynthesis
MRDRLPSPFELDQRPVAAIYRTPLFNASETFVRDQICGLVRYQPLVIGRDDKGNIPEALAGRVLFRSRAEAVRRHAPVLLHAHFGTDGLRALPLAERLAVPLVTNLHGYDVGRSRSALLLSGRRSWMHYALRRRALQRRGTLFLAVSEALRRQAIALGYPAERTRTHYNGVDLAEFPVGPGGPGTILFVGRLVEKKGVEILLRAFGKVRQSRADASLIVIGDGPLRARLLRLAGQSVRFLGSLPREEVAAWMRRSTVLAAPSVTARDGDVEGLPTTIVEAAASGLPAVGTRHSGIPEAIADGETGFLVPERDAAALGDRLLALLNAPDLRDRMGAAARRLAEDRFDFTRQMARLEAIYDEVRMRPCG